jgi:adenylosuccinate lyase
VLLALTEAGVPRKEAYVIVQRCAFDAWQRGELLLDRLRAEPAVAARLSDEQLEKLFDLHYHTRHVDTVFRRVFGA